MHSISNTDIYEVYICVKNIWWSTYGTFSHQTRWMSHEFMLDHMAPAWVQL